MHSYAAFASLNVYSPAGAGACAATSHFTVKIGSKTPFQGLPRLTGAAPVVGTIGRA